MSVGEPLLSKIIDANDVVPHSDQAVTEVGT